MKPSRVLMVLFALVALAAASALVPQPAVARQAAQATVAPTAASGTSGATLIGAFDVGPGGGPQQRPFDQTAGNTWLMKIWSPLVSLNKDSTGLEAQLATKWTPNTDATQWTFDLRPNVKWHDGDAFTASDVKFTFELALNPAFGWRNDPGVGVNLVGASEYMSGTVKEVSGIKVVDPQTVQFSLKATDPRFPYKLIAAYMLPQHALKDQDPAKLAKSDWFLASPIGTGPFKLSKYVKDQYQDLVPNDYYWNGKPKLAHLINRYFADETASDIALEKGEIQFSYVGGDVAARLKTNASYQVFEGSSFTSNYIIFNYRDKRLQDVRVRQAFMYAIDRKAIVKDVYLGAAYLEPCTLPQQIFWPGDVNWYEYNPTKAQQLLKDAGWNSGDSLELWTYYATQQQKDALQAIQGYLSQVGVKVTPKIMDTPAYNAQFYSGQGWPLSYRGYGLPAGQSPRPALLASPQTNDKKAWSGLDDPKLADLLTTAEKALNDADYAKGMQAVCKYMNDNVVEGSLWVGTRYGAASAKVKNFYYYPAPAGGPYEDHPELWDVVQ